MRISSSAYMGVETLVRLAARGADGPCTTQGLAECINRSVSYTEGLMARLRKAGLVVARHGPGGGYILAKPPHRITVAEVFQAVDERLDLPGRPLNTATLDVPDIDDLHGTDLLWEALRGYVLLFLDGISVADLAPETAHLVSDDGDEQAGLYPTDMRSMARH